MNKHQARVCFLVLVLLTGFVSGGCAIREALVYEVPANSWFVVKYLFFIGFAIFCEALVVTVVRTATSIFNAETKRSQRRPYRGKVCIRG